MSDALVLADPATAAVFALTDLAVRPVREADSAGRLLAEAAAAGCDVIFITERVAVGLADEIRSLQAGGGTLVTVIPGIGDAGALGREMLSAFRAAVLGT